MGEGSANLTDPHHTPTIIQPSTQPQKIQKPRKPRKDTHVPQSSDPTKNVADEAVHKELGDSLVRAATTAFSLEAEQDNVPRCQETMGDTIAQTRFENVSKHSNDSLLTRGNTLQSDEDRLKLDELMALCTTLQNRVLDLEKTKTTQHNEIASLKRRVKKLEKKNRSRTHKLKRLYKVGLTARVESSDNEESLGEDASKQGRIDAIDADEEITLVSVQNVDEEMFDVNVLDGEEVFVAEQEVAANKENDEVNVVEEVVEVINTAKLITDAAQVSAAGNVVSTAGDATTVSAATTTTATITTVDDITLAQALMEIKSTKPKEKGVVIQELGESTTTISSQLSSQQSQDKGKGILIEPVKPMKKKDLIRLDEEVALKLQAEFDKEERLAREKAEKEKEANISLIETWDDIQAKIDADHQLAERLQAQEQEELSIKENATLFQQLLEKRKKHFAAKRAEDKRSKPPTKAQLRKIMCIYLNNMEEYKLKYLNLKEFDSIQEMFDRAFKRVNTFEDFRTELVEGKEKRVGTELIQENVKKQDLEDLYKLVKAKYKSTRPLEDLDLILWGDLKTMFEPHVEDKIWRNQQEYKVLDWKLYDSCGVHSLRMQHMQIYMLAKKKYPLAPLTLSMTLEKKLIIDYESEMAYQLLQFIIKQLKNLLDIVWIATAHVCVNAAQLELVLLRDFKENMLTEVNAASENMLEVTTASESQVNASS
ncbi:hypothetical protein Tco_0340818 [Tanacetum coccineum]